MNRRSYVILPILPLWAFVGWFFLLIAVGIELGLLGLFLGIVELMLVRNGLAPANHPLHFRGEAAALILVAGMFANYAQVTDPHAHRGIYLLLAIVVILLWSALDAYALPRR